jgi:hypothetical protein
METPTNSGDADAPWLSGVGCTWRNRTPTEVERTLLLTGMARGGTSFVASSIAHLGVPLGRHEGDAVSEQGEHVLLRQAFKDRDEMAFERLVGEFDREHATWAWKLPALRKDLEWASRRVRNPCYVIVFREPLSVSLRKISNGRAPDLRRMFRKIFDEYDALLEFALGTKRPVLLVSYDKALRQFDEWLSALASFAGVASYDAASIREKVRRDGAAY